MGVQQTVQRSESPITHGGAIYLRVHSGAENKFWFGGARYSPNTNYQNVARYGKSLFIDADDLMLTVPENTSEKIGYRLDQYQSDEESNLENLQGYDRKDNGTGAGAFPIPMFYLYTHVDYCVHNVDNPIAPYISPYDIKYGHDDAACGHYRWPCYSIEYAKDVSYRRHVTNHSLGLDADHRWNVRKVGIMTGYTMNISYSNWFNGSIFEIQNSYPPLGQYGGTYLNSEFKISSGQYFNIDNTQNSDKSFEMRMLDIKIEDGTDNYIIQAFNRVAEIQIFECTLTMFNSGSISRGLVDLRKGTLTMIYLNAYNITLPNGPLFKPIQTAGLVSISGSQFTSIQRSDAGGSVISRVITGRYDGVNIRTSQFTSCSVTGSNQSGGAININIKNSAEAKFEIIEYWEKKTTFSNCSSTDRGGAIYLDLAAGQEQNFDLRGARYADDNFATNGRSIFINAQGDLRIAVPENQGVKIGAGLESYEEFNLDNLMGYD
ncbi:MAG: hypothetical protein EZS28_007856 [Streblomastix strix]|uniref:Uncharacterized protein n=1 Tax=Streblomastix strix TaxID=222440 RepID=A0A5J4WNU0_9EUKA|nr:MAG: hypothetical protein EZS28_007856 [Streblomastix strix]